MFERFKIKKRGKELALISIPVIIEHLFTTFMGMINMLMTAAVGEYAISAISMIDSISNIVIALFMALTTGSTIVISQYYGSGDRKSATKSAAQSLVLASMISAVILIVFALFSSAMVEGLFKKAEQDVFSAAKTYLFITAFSYPAIAICQTFYGIFRGTGDTRTPMAVTLAMNVCNVILTYLLVFGLKPVGLPGLGVTGAAIALTIARYVGVLLCCYLVFIRKQSLNLNNLAIFKPDFKTQSVVLGLGVPTSVESGLFQVGKLITQTFIVLMGTAALAANSVAGAVFMLVLVPGNALITAVMIMIGQRIGRGDDDDVIPTANFAICAGMVFMTIICLACLPLTNTIIALYKIGPEAADYLRLVLYSGYVFTPLLWPVAFIVPAALRACGDVKFPMVVSISTMWTFRIISGYLLGVTMELGILGVWLGMYIDWAARGILYYTRLRLGKWRGKSITRRVSEQSN